jgi:class 3 adenylate cyclase
MQNAGVVDPVDRYAVIPEVSIWVAFRALPVSAKDPGTQQRLGCRNGGLGASGDRASSARRRRASPADRDVHRPRWLDLVGSTALSTKLDPEDLRCVIGAYHKCVAETIARFDGFVAKYMGDGVLIYFGYPHAHEDDAERAARAGLALIEAVGKLQVQELLFTSDT